MVRSMRSGPRDGSRPRALFRAAPLFAASCVLSVAGLFGHGGIDEVVVELDRLIAENPEEAALYLRRGELQRSRGEWEPARRDFERARQLEPGLHLVDLYTGRLWLESGEPARALEALDRFLRTKPGDPFALRLKGRALIAEGHPLEAVAVLDLALASHAVAAIDPDPEIFAARAQALAAAEGEANLDRALQGLEEGLAQLGGPVSLEIVALSLEEESGRSEAALRRLERLAQTSPRPEAWLLRRGELLETVGRLDEAARTYRAALTSIEGLPAAKRATAGFQDMESRIRSALARLGAITMGRPDSTPSTTCAGGSS
jgi:predicted Zn-dependent protease